MYDIIPFIWKARIGKSIETGSKLVIATQERRVMGKKQTAEEYRVSFGGDGNILNFFLLNYFIKFFIRVII